MRILSNEHAAEMQLVWLYRQDTEIIRRHAHVLSEVAENTGDAEAAQLASEYLAHLEMREQERKAA